MHPEILKCEQVASMRPACAFLSMADFPMFAVGFVTAFVVAMIAIKTFLALIRRLDFIPFAIYRFVVAFAVYLVFVA